VSAEVVRLPTAAPRKVRQRWSKVSEADLDKCAEFPDKFIRSPYQARCRELARLMLDAERATMMQLAMALFATAPAEQQAKMQGRLIALKVLKRAGAAEALAWLEYETAPKERKRHIDMAAGEVAAEMEGEL
jgi:hypothetical protein